MTHRRCAAPVTATGTVTVMTTNTAARTVVRLATIAALLVAAVGVFHAPEAGAQASCDAIVHDATGALRGDESRIAASAERLIERHRAVVRVRVTGELPGGEPEVYLADQVRSCASWSDGSGGRAARLVAVIVSPQDRATGLYYGGAFSALDTEERTIQLQVMNPSFAEGDFAGGIAAGLEAAADVLERPTTSSGTRTPSPSRTAATSDTGALIGFVFIVALALVAVAVYFAVRVLRRRRARHALAVELTDRRSTLGETVYQSSDLLDGLSNEILVAATHPRDLEELNGLHAELERLHHDLSVQVAEIEVPSPAAATDENLTAARDVITEAELSAAKFEAQLNAARATIEELQEFTYTFTDRLRAATEAADGAEAAIAAAAAEGFGVTRHQASLDEARAQLAAVDSHAAEDCRTGARDALAAAADATRHAADAGELPARHAAATAQHDANTAELRAVTSRAATATSTLDELGRRWAGSAVSKYRASLEEANRHLTDARDAHDRVDLARHRFDGSTIEAVTAVTSLLGTANQALAHVERADGELAAAAAEAERLAAQAEALRIRVEQHRYRRGFDTSAFDTYGTHRGQRIDPFAAQVAAAAALASANSAWAAAESARRSAQAAANSYSSSSRYGGGGSSSGFGGGGSSSSFGGGGSSSRW